MERCKLSTNSTPIQGFISVVNVVGVQISGEYIWYIGVLISGDMVRVLMVSMVIATDEDPWIGVIFGLLTTDTYPS